MTAYPNLFAIVVREPGQPELRHVFAAREITIGSDPAGPGAASPSHLTLAHPSVSSRHARLVIRDGKYIVVDLKSDRGTFVNAKRLTSPLVIKPADRIRCGEIELALRPVIDLPLAKRTGGAAVTEPVEEALLVTVERNDPASRLVYADWLEERGRTTQAEFLRLQETMAVMRVDDPTFARTTARMRALADAVDIHWRVRVARPAVARCVATGGTARGGTALAFDFPCPMEWGALAPTDRPHVRRCDSCNENVHYCASVEEAREHAARGACVAIDLDAPRWKDDLEAPFGALRCRGCNLDVGVGVEQCPRCDTPVRQMVRGRMPVPR